MKKILLLSAIIIGFSACKDNSSRAKQSITDSAIIKSGTGLNGEELYNTNCASCHLKSGEGVPGAYPPLAGSNWLTEKRKASIHAIKYGQEGKIEVNGVFYNNVMPNPNLSDAKIAAILNYVMKSWGNEQEKEVTEQEVSAVKKL